MLLPPVGVFGVGHKVETQLPLPFVTIEGAIWFAFAVGVCNNPESLSDVRGANRASWNIKRPCGVAFALQVREYFVQAQLDEPNNVFSNNPSGPAFPDKSKHFRPEVAGVVLSSLLSRLGKRLTRESSANNIGSGREVGSSDTSDIPQNRNVGPVMFQNRLAVRILLYKTSRIKETGGLEPSRKATDS